MKRTGLVLPDLTPAASYRPPGRFYAAARKLQLKMAFWNEA